MEMTKDVREIVKALPQSEKYQRDQARIKALLANYGMVLWPEDQCLSDDPTMISFVHWLTRQADLIEGADWVWLADPESADYPRIVVKEEDADELDRLIKFIISQLS